MTDTTKETSQDWDWLADGTAPTGFRAAGVRAGLKTAGTDLALIVSEGDAVGAAVFTRSQFCAPPVSLSRLHAADGCISAIAANSGCANACTGPQGLADAREMASLVGDALQVPPSQVLVASTGIIGHSLPMQLLRDAIPQAVHELRPDGLAAASEAILTTDTRPKLASLSIQIDGKPVILAGMVKGAGMVAPRMATVFGFFMTDAAIEPALLQTIFRRVMDHSLNRVTVDGDTSTNDTACILASGGSKINRIEADGPAACQFEAGLTALAQRLARKLARDGEGANHLITVRVKGTQEEAEAETIALAIANSPLVKTAIFGRDPNWGRIAMAAGRAGVPFEQERVDIFLNGIAVARAGMREPFDEAQLHDELGQDEITIEVNLNSGNAEAEAWTCDFSYDYVKINAEYHT